MLTNNVVPIQLADWFCRSCMIFQPVILDGPNLFCAHCRSTIAQVRVTDPLQLVIELDKTG